MVYNPFEGKIVLGIAKKESVRSLHERALFERSYKEMARTLNGARIKERDFEDKYTSPQVEEDLVYVKERKRDSETELTREEEEARKLAVIAEGLFFRGGNEWGWLGKDARIIKTSEYDDWKNGVDGIIEFKGEEDDERVSHTAYGVDVTYGGRSTVRKKFQIVKREIEMGNLAKVKYFQSGSFKGERWDVPRIVIGAEKKHIMEILALGDKDAVRRHPYQTLMLKIMQLQFESLAAYALEKDKIALAEAFRSEEKRIRRVLQQKIIEHGRIPERLIEDKVVRAICAELKEFNPKISW